MPPGWAIRDCSFAISGRLPTCPATSRPTAGRVPRAAASIVELVDWCRYVVDREASGVSGVMHPSNCKQGEEDYQMMSLDFSDCQMPRMRDDCPD